MNYNFLIIGGDTRIASLAKLLKRDGNNVKTYANEIKDFDIEELNTLEDAKIECNKCDIIISSIPLTKDNINVYSPNSDKIISIQTLKEISKDKKIIAGKLDGLIEGYDALEDEALTILNTIPTAEGAIQVAMEETTYTLNNMNVLVLGFGRVGKLLSYKLKNLGANVYTEARKESDLAWIKAYGYTPIDLKDLNNYLCKMDAIFNTVPVKILDKSRLILISSDSLIVDLASYPYGVDFEAAKKLGIKTKIASALPGKVAPDTAAIYVKDYVYRVLNK